MDCIEILGGRPLRGTVRIQGSKNAALPILAATVLNKGITVLHNCPRIIDVRYMVSILEHIGCKVNWSGNTLTIDAAEISSCEIPSEFAEKMRCSVILLGSLISRQKKVLLPYPGGCTIGERPIDLHLKSLRKQGVKIEEREGKLRACSEKTKGCVIPLPIPSVGATENAILAAVLAVGTTYILNGAMEPEICELCRFLNQCGASITGEGTSEITINGVKELHDAEFTIMPDRIVAGTYMLAVTATKGVAALSQVPVAQMNALLQAIKQMGVSYCMKGGLLCLDARRAIHPITYVETAPYPGFPTDLQSQMMAALCILNGRSCVKETIFEARFKAVSQLNRMGASISVYEQENAAVINGVSELFGCTVEAEELRGGAALVIAGLAAKGRTVIENRHFIERGYENICQDLQNLGARIVCKNNRSQNDQDRIP